MLTLVRVKLIPFTITRFILIVNLMTFSGYSDYQYKPNKQDTRQVNHFLCICEVNIHSLILDKTLLYLTDFGNLCSIVITWLQI